MEIEPVDVGVTRAWRDRRHVFRRVAALAHARFGPRARRHASVHVHGRGNNQRRKDFPLRAGACLRTGRKPRAGLFASGLQAERD
jgi:hypothetical protein